MRLAELGRVAPFPGTNGAVDASEESLSGLKLEFSHAGAACKKYHDNPHDSCCSALDVAIVL